MTRAKEQIREIVKEYKKLFPAEYKQFLVSNRKRIDDLGVSNDFAEVKGSEMVMRHLFELPETMFYAIKRGLTEQEFNWLFSRDEFEKKREGQKWFMREFPEFKVSRDF